MDLRQSVGDESSKWLPLSGKHNDLHLLRCVMVFSILFALPPVGRDFVHELENREDLIVPCCTDLQTATQVSSGRRFSLQLEALLLCTARLECLCALEGR